MLNLEHCIYSSSDSDNFSKQIECMCKPKKMALTIILDRFKSLVSSELGSGPTLRYEGHFESPGFVWQGWVLTPPSWPCLSLPPPRLYGWMGSQGMGRKSSMWPHLPMPQQLGGLLTKPSTIPNPRLQCSAIKALPRNTFNQRLAPHAIHHIPPSHHFIQAKFSIGHFNFSMESHFLFPMQTSPRAMFEWHNRKSDNVSGSTKFNQNIFPHSLPEIKCTCLHNWI